VTFAVKITGDSKTDTKIELDGAKATLTDLESGDLVTVQAKERKGATSFTARMVDAETPPADPVV
jgi:hypothetical protein